MKNELTRLERAVSVFSPKRAVAMAQSRFMVNFAGQYAGARRDKTSLRNFNPGAGSADADSIGDLPTLRARSRDLGRNAPIARGARNTSKTNVVGPGLRLSARVDRALLGLTEEQAEAIQSRLQTLFHLWAKAKTADAARRLNFYQMQALAFTSAWDSGDCFALRRFKESSSFLALAVQLIEADRVSTPVDRQNEELLRDGVELDGDGQPIAYHILNRHPGDNPLFHGLTPQDWARVPALGKSGDPLIVHLMDMDRIAQTRGVPSLAPVIEALKQLDRYAEAELMAAVVSAFFTVFIKTTGEEATGIEGVELPPGMAQKNELALGSGTIAELAPDESIETANPNRPNANFDPFFLAVIRQIGIALGIPYEVLIMHFSSSYTASKAAIETARQFFMDRRAWLANDFCQPVYEWFLTEAVARDLVDMPGFLDDPIKRAAWCGSEWIGRAPIVLDAVKEATAANLWLANGGRTLEQITTEAFGTDWKSNQEQRGRETALRRELTIEASVPVGEPTPAELGDNGDSGPDGTGDDNTKGT
jgi:lambda family phage portal protein